MTMLQPTLSSAPLSTVRLSSVVPATMTEEGSKDYKLTNMDLALKLHYIKAVYFFTAEAVEGLTIYDLKTPMFPWLTLYYTASGRIRRSDETGRPFIKCNDGGVRIGEAFCDKTVEEWMAKNSGNFDDDFIDSFLLAYDQVVGPDLGFSPLVFIQFTWFKCGGMAVGLSWAHILGDPFSASNFINKWGQFTKGNEPIKSLHLSNTEKQGYSNSVNRKPFSVKRVDHVGDHWVITNNCKMETHSFHFTAKQLDNLVSELGNSGLIQPAKNSYFQVISAIIWKSLSKIREDSGPKIVTICTRTCCNSENEFPSNKMVFTIVKADFSSTKGGVDELAALMAKKQEEENGLIEEMVGDNGDQLDCILYGANLTFVNMEDVNIYGLELKGHKPVYANYSIKGVGDEGAALVLPAGPDNGGDGRSVTVILPEYLLKELKKEIKQEYGVV